MPKVLSYHRKSPCGRDVGMGVDCPTTFVITNCGATACPNTPAPVICLTPDGPPTGEIECSVCKDNTAAAYYHVVMHGFDYEGEPFDMGPWIVPVSPPGPSGCGGLLFYDAPDCHGEDHQGSVQFNLSAGIALVTPCEVTAGELPSYSFILPGAPDVLQEGSGCLQTLTFIGVVVNHVIPPLLIPDWFLVLTPLLDS